MTTLATFAVPLLHRLAFGFRGRSQPRQQESAGPCGPAQNIDQTPIADGLALLQAQRLALLTEAWRQKNLRRSKDASICEAELRRVTHEILNIRRRTNA